MPLILTAPNSNSIRTYRNGVKVFRLHDFLGPARGTLSTENDSSSVCGTVIRDTQTVSYSGSLGSETISTNLKSSGSDTARIHMDDLNLNPNFRYHLIIGAKAEGAVDPTKRNAAHTYLQIGSNAAGIGLYGAKADLIALTDIGATNAPNPLTNPYYTLLTAGTAMSPGTFTEGYEWLLIRAGTGTGGTFEWVLDVLYLIPNGAYTFNNPNNPYVANNFRYLNSDFFDPVEDFDTNVYDDSFDDVPLDWAGQYSVMPVAPQGNICLLGQNSSADYQEGNNEKSFPDITNNFTTSNWQKDPSSDLTICAGSIFTPSHQIDEDQFDRTTTENLNQYLGESSENRAWRILNDHPMQAVGSPRGIYCDGTQMIFSKGKYDLDFEFYFPDPPDSVSGSTGDPIAVQLGSTANEIGTGSTNEKHQVLNEMNHCIMECMVSTDHILVAGFQMYAGFARTTSGDFIGVCLDIPSQDSFGLRTSSSIFASLVYYQTFGIERELQTQPHETHLDGPTELTSSFAANTWIRIKVERLWYKYRAKAWLDGDTEPSSWQFEAFMPMPTDTDSTIDVHEYPWTTHSNLGLIRRDTQNQYPTMGVRYFRPIENMSGGSMLFDSPANVRVTSTYWKDLVLTSESYGITPSNVHLQMGSYDDILDYGSITIPYDSQRVIIAPTAKYIFNADDNGFYVSLYKEPGAPDSQATALGDIIEKQVISGPIHLESIRFRSHEDGDA